MKKFKFSLYYNIAIALLALTSISLVICDLTHIISLTAKPYSMINAGILILFWIDYIVRLFFSSDKKKFIKTHVFDLLAILPFSEIFTFFRVSRLFQIAGAPGFLQLIKATRLIRIAGFLGAIKDNLLIFFKTNGFIYVLYSLLGLIAGSAAIISVVEKKTFWDAVWWSIVTATTVGYGDISPSTPLGRIVAVILMLFGIGFIGMLTSTITSYFIREKNAKSAQINAIIASLSDTQKSEVLKYLNQLIEKDSSP